MRIVFCCFLLVLLTAANVGAEDVTFDPRVSRLLGPLPRRGDLSDILSCAGTNEIVWIALMKENPRNPNAHEAKRKAGYYTSVALSVFEVDSGEIFKAINVASKLTEDVRRRVAWQCREAPTNWRE